ncbi:MAG: GNAT family N-acetyltransferase [Hyphomicrobiaceae bacterium]
MPTGPSFSADPGFYEVPQGRLATIVTSLEMLARPSIEDAPAPTGMRLEELTGIGAEDYRRLYARVGADWLWFSRLRMGDDELLRIIRDSAVDIYGVAVDGDQFQGLLELDFRDPGTCEIAFFGLSGAALERRLGGWLMRETLRLAWSRPIVRLWVHTCTLDHPRALGFYRRFGFTPFKQQIEIIDDPRLDGTLPRTAAPHIPLIA